MDYTILDGEYYKVLYKDNNDLITYGKLEEGQILSTNHTVIFITEDEYNEFEIMEDNF